MAHNLFNTLQTFTTDKGKTGQFYSLPQLEKEGVGPVARLPGSIRVVLESVLRNYDEKVVEEADVRALANWGASAERTEEIPFNVARVLLQDFTGVPLLVDLAAMRSAVARMGRKPKIIEPLVPVDLVIDHSVQVDFWASPDALRLNMETEFRRNRSRYQFLKWGMQAFKSFNVVPPGIGIVHQVNLEYLARGVMEREGVYYPDTLVGTDSHTTMINGLGIVGWGVGGIEAEAAMLGQPVYILTPDVVGVNLTGSLREGVTATDLVLRVTEMLRKAKVVGKFVEFHGEGASSIPVADRATIGNMAPEYGATMGYFPVDEKTCEYLLATGRDRERVETFRAYYEAQGLFGIPRAGEIDYSTLLELDLSTIEPTAEFVMAPNGEAELGHGDVVIAAITSCTNTSNPGVMLAAGLLAKKAVERGLRVPPTVKPSLAPGSRVVTEYYRKTGLQQYLDHLGFQLVGYGCTTCIGNSGPLDPRIESVISEHDLVTAAVLSGNRNFEARVHQSVRANFLMSPPLVVAFALAGRVNIDMTSEPLGKGKDGEEVFLRDIWPTLEEVGEGLGAATDPETYRRLYSDFAEANPLWNDIPAVTGEVYEWDSQSTYIQEPPYFERFSMEAGTFCDIKGARPLAIFGDSVTTDHISPAGAIKAQSPAGRYLLLCGVAVQDFNSYGSRRGNHQVMVRGTRSEERRVG